MAQQGMMEREGMLKAMKGYNPLASYAVYECFSGGGGKCAKQSYVVQVCTYISYVLKPIVLLKCEGDLASPYAADQMLEKWKADGNLDGFKAALTKVNI